MIEMLFVLPELVCKMRTCANAVAGNASATAAAVSTADTRHRP
jgi:hypothetical protein